MPQSQKEKEMLKDARAAFGGESNVKGQLSLSNTIKLTWTPKDPTLVDRFKEHGDELAKANPDSFVWVIDNTQEPPVAQLEPLASLDSTLVSNLKKVLKLMNLRNKNASKKKFLVSLGKEPDSQIMGMRKPNKEWEEEYLEEVS